jgi:hypothetical protein
MKLVLSNLIFGMFVCCLETQASESMLPSDYEEHISIHSPTPEELKKAIGEEKLNQIIAYAPKLADIKDDIVLQYGIGRQRIEAKISTLLQENKQQEAKSLQELLSY